MFAPCGRLYGTTGFARGSIPDELIHFIAFMKTSGLHWLKQSERIETHPAVSPGPPQ